MGNTPSRMVLQQLSSRARAWFAQQPLARLLGLIVLVTALPLFLAAYLSLDRLIENERESNRAGLMLNAKVLADLIDNEIETHAAIAKTLSQSVALREGNLAAFREQASQALALVPPSWIDLSDPDGRPVLSTLVPYGTPLPARPLDDVVGQVVATGKSQIGPIARGSISGRFRAFLHVPVSINGAVAHVLSISLVPDQFYRLIEARFSNELVAVLDRELHFVTRLPGNDTHVGTSPTDAWRAAIAKAPEGFTDNPSLEGRRNLNAYTRSAYGWTVGVAQWEDVLAAPHRSVVRALVAMIAGLTLVSLVLSALLARHAAVGMSSLAADARLLGMGQVPATGVAPFLEAGAIGVAIRGAAEDIAAHERAMTQIKGSLEHQVVERTASLVAEIESREKAEAQNRQLQKMDAIGQLTGGIAHDFNNMLAIVISSLELTRRRLQQGRTDVEELIAGGLDGANRAVRLTQRLLAFARQQPLSPQPLDPNRLLASLGDLLRRSLGSDVRLETVLAGGVWPVCADVSQLENAIVNLAINARDAMPGGGKLTIETSNSHLDEAYEASHAEVAAGQYVLFAVSDTGIGMTAEAVSRAFEPFYTTKPPGRGTGLGLSQVYGFIKQSKGHVKIYSEPGHGTTIKLYLPRFLGTLQQDAVSPLPPSVSEGARPSETILVVEDEARVRQLTVASLREFGYVVVECDGAQAALAALEREPRIDLLFTDIVMPDVNGRRLADEAVKRWPHLKVLFTTGFTRNAIIHNGLLDAGVEFIAKPYSVAALGQKVRAVLHGVPLARGPSPRDDAVHATEVPDAARALDRLNVLVVEDDPIISLDLQAKLSEAGGRVVGPAHTVAQAMALIDGTTVDVAVLDFRLEAETAAPVADRLLAAAVPILFYTSYRSDLQDRYAKVPVVEKPLNAAHLIAELRAIAGRRPPSV